MSTLSFLKEGLRNLRTTGTITRSGKALCNAAIDRIDFEKARVIVELGAGDGVITRHILERLHPKGTVLAFEVAEDLCEDMRAIGDPRLIVINDSAAKISKYLKKHRKRFADHIVSAIPFAALPEEEGRKIVAAAKKNLRYGGKYNQVHYSLKTLDYYKETFGNAETKRVFLNLPPAYVIYCEHEAPPRTARTERPARKPRNQEERKPRNQQGRKEQSDRTPRNQEDRPQRKSRNTKEQPERNKRPDKNKENKPTTPLQEKPKQEKRKPNRKNHPMVSQEDLSDKAKAMEEKYGNEVYEDRAKEIVENLDESRTHEAIPSRFANEEYEVTKVADVEAALTKSEKTNAQEEEKKPKSKKKVAAKKDVSSAPQNTERGDHKRSDNPSSTMSADNTDEKITTPIQPETTQAEEEPEEEIWFEDLDIADEVLDGLDDMGFTKCTPVQALAIPPALEGRDVLAVAQTGTGKTAAFLLPIISKLTDNPVKKVNTIILTPTRELAMQIDRQLEAFSFHTPVSSIAIYGGRDGHSMVQERNALKTGAPIVVATPGRLIAHLDMGYTDLSECNHLVFDEADRMLDMGFVQDMQKIIGMLPKEGRQTLFFSATMPPKIRAFSKEILKNPVEISIAISKPAEKIDQKAYDVIERGKVKLVTQIVQEKKDLDRILIFAGTKKGVRELTSALQRKKMNVAAVSSDLDQKERENRLVEFRSGRLRIIVATDVLSRGIHINGIDLVINYDVPGDAEDYVHRIGRTARAAAEGAAITLISPKDKMRFKRIEELIGDRITRLPLEGDLEVFDPRKGGGNDRRGGGGGGNRGRGRSGGGNRGGGNRNSGGGRGRNSSGGGKRN